MRIDWNGWFTILIISVLDWRNIGLRILNEDDVWQFCLSANFFGIRKVINVGWLIVVSVRESEMKLCGCE